MAEQTPESFERTIDETGTTHPSKGLGYVDKLPEYDPQERMDTVRSQLTFCLVGLLALVIVGAFVLVMTKKQTGLEFTDIRMIIELLTTPIVALVGAAVGFYFGTHVAGTRTGRRRRSG